MQEVVGRNAGGQRQLAPLPWQGEGEQGDLGKYSGSLGGPLRGKRPLDVMMRRAEGLLYETNDP